MFILFVKCYTEQYFNFSGRSSRKEYISFVLFYALMNFILNILMQIFGFEYIGIIFLIISLISLVPQVNLITRRLHDIGYPGFVQLVLIPVAFAIKYYEYSNLPIIMGLSFCAMIIFIKGTPGSNKYGPPPEY